MKTFNEGVDAAAKYVRERSYALASHDGDTVLKAIAYELHKTAEGLLGLREPVEPEKPIYNTFTVPKAVFEKNPLYYFHKVDRKTQVVVLDEKNETTLVIGPEGALGDEE